MSRPPVFAASALVTSHQRRLSRRKIPPSGNQRNPFHPHLRLAVEVHGINQRSPLVLDRAMMIQP
jgi:hypothetical protein